MNFLICSYYTLDTPYQKVAHEYLMKSIYALDPRPPSDVAAVPNLGSWQNNTSYKPTFIDLMLKKHPNENLVFVDADAQILRYPDLFNNIPEDYHIAAHLLDRVKWYNHEIGERKELLSGTLFIRNSPEGHVIVNEWMHMCKLYPHIWEQALLQRVLIEHDIRLYELPIDYCYIVSMPDGREPYIKCDEPVIVHNQVSRKLKRRVHP